MSAGKEKEKFLIDRADELFTQNEWFDPSEYDAVMRILERYFFDSPEDTAQRSRALHLKALVCHAQGDTEESFRCFREAAKNDFEHPDMAVGAWEYFAEFTILYGKTELFDEAERYVAAQYDKLGFTLGSYTASAILAFFAERKGDTEKQKYYLKRGEETLLDVIMNDKKIMYTSIIGKKDLGFGLWNSIRGLMLKRGYRHVIGLDGSVVWQKPNLSAFNELVVYCAFDVVIIKASVWLYNGIKGYKQKGLVGFLHLIEKQSLKKIIEELEKFIADY